MPGTVCLRARSGSSCAAWHRPPRAETWVAATWVTDDRVGEIESLSVLPEHRGVGIGSALLDALEQALAARGVLDLVIGVVPGNEAAIRLYERRGFLPTWSYLSRFSRRRDR